jgi:UDP-2,4-diacetamido-2,4,6-trideoxy-beta-L-altropyranose hydrolase
MKPGAVLVRADASLAIGTGHVMRCLALAQAWQDRGGTAAFAAAELPDALAPRLTAENLGVCRIEATAGDLEDARETIAEARRIEANWVVIDGDRFGSEYLESIRAAGFRVLLVDDFATRKSYPVDLIANPNLDADEGPYRKQGTRASVCVGVSYVLLRREFRQAGVNRKIRPEGNRILVTLGGSDPDHLTGRIVAALAACSSLEVTAVVGAGFDRGEEWQALPPGQVRVVRNAANMALLARDADVAIISAGGTLWELLAMGCAILSYSRNIVQKRAVEALSARRMAVNLGEARNFDAVQLVAQVQEVAASRAAREQMCRLGRGLVDGLGATRIVEAMQDWGARGW